ILMDRSQIPNSMGLQVPLRANIGEVSSRGFEVSADYSHYFTPDFWLSGRGNITYATSRFEVYEDLDYVSAGMPWKSKIGNSLSQPYGYIAERLFVDEADIANSPIQTFGNYAAGDIKYKDINNDGLINSNDIVPIGYPTTPGIIYGFGISSGYKGFDFSVFFQGSARSSFFVDPHATSPFQNQNALLKSWADSHWSEDDRNIYAEWPRLSDEIVENNVQNSTWWLRNGAFLRLKAIEFGYTFNKKNVFMDKIGLSSARFYFSGTNLFSLSSFKLWDVEMGGNGLAYPLQRVMNLGVNLNF
ncbi:MAG: TonB-dependent receptor, partial [Bacteroidales bacterium]